VGVQAHPQKFWFDENSGKVCGNLHEIHENLAKLLRGQKWRPMCFDLKKMAPNVCRITWRPFFGGHPENSRHDKLFPLKSAQNLSGQAWRILGKNPSHPQKFSCSYNRPVPAWAKSFLRGAQNFKTMFNIFFLGGLTIFKGGEATPSYVLVLHLCSWM